MLRESMLAHNDDWAIGIISEMERLRRVAAKSSSDRVGGSDALKLAHKQLHVALTAGSTSQRLGKMQDFLFDQAGRYRDIMIAEMRSPKHFVETHEALVQTILSGNVDKACEALREHLQRTLREVYSPVGSDTVEPPPLA
jgi:GntR family carbon starvation induced transcriptional regulator